VIVSGFKPLRAPRELIRLIQPAGLCEILNEE
jgi:hypothetical protein